MTRVLSGHQRIDQRSLAMHRAIAEKLRLHPELLKIARENLSRWMAMNGQSQAYFETWREILNRPLPEILDLLRDEGEKMTALRQSSPFAGVLTPKERWEIYARFGQNIEDL